jgi:hypothetical protein
VRQVLALVPALGLAVSVARAQVPPPAGSDLTPASPGASPAGPSAEPAPAGSVTATAEGGSILPEPPPEAPPPLPHHKGFVIEQSLGALGFIGGFRHVAPAGYWLHTQAGYEIFNWLMVFGEGELIFTDTSEAVDPSKVIAFPIYGFGGGLRVTVHITDRVAFFVQGAVDGMKADVPKQALTILGYHNAESIDPSFGGRLGVEWYQIDRHLALGLEGGVRDATGFAKFAGGDTGLMWDGGAAIRYTF